MSDRHCPGYRVALIGYGTAGAVFHAPLIDATPSLTLAAVVTGSTERATAVETAYPTARVHRAADEIWARAADFDLVVIATPNIAHVPLAHAAITAGLAVVVDKPLAAGTDDARALIEQAEARNVALTVFHNRRWDSDYLTLTRLLDNGRLGPVRRFESRFERWRPTAKSGWKRNDDPAAAGGILFDLGSHLIDQALCLFGPVERVYAELAPRYTPDGVDDDAFLALRHTNGTLSHLWMSSVAAVPGPRFRVQGEQAGYEKYGMDGQEDALRAGHRPDDDDWSASITDTPGQIRRDDEAEPLVNEPGDYPAFYRRVAVALAGNAALPVDPMDAYRVLAVIEAARTGAARGETITLAR